MTCYAGRGYAFPSCLIGGQPDLPSYAAQRVFLDNVVRVLFAASLHWNFRKNKFVTD